ncbi:MAG: hypothetical protein ACK44Y_17690 [Novosphingobium sp.]|jgi:hypothetical protein
MNVTCAALALALSDPTGGGSYTLTTDCQSSGGRPALIIRSSFKRPVIINAQGRRIKGLVFDGGSNIVWKGGRIEAPLGSGERKQVGPGHYAVLIKGKSRNIAFEGVSLTNARKAIVFGQPASGLTLRNSRCFGAVEDCLIASGGQDIVVSDNIFGPFQLKSSFCMVGASEIEGIAKRDCVGRNGQWHAGWHSDVVQLRNGIANVVLENNDIDTIGQGLTQMDKDSDAPIRNVRIARNRIQAGRHGITLGRCIDCVIEQNILKTSMGHLKWKAVIIPGQARACNNSVPSGGPGRGTC